MWVLKNYLQIIYYSDLALSDMYKLSDSFIHIFNVLKPKRKHAFPEGFTNCSATKNIKP